MLFGGWKEGKRGWKRKCKEERRERERVRSTGDVELAARKRDNRRVVSTGPGMLDALKGMVFSEEPEDGGHMSETKSVDDDDLPEWAKRQVFEHEDLGAYTRIYAPFRNSCPLWPITHTPPGAAPLVLPAPPVARALRPRDAAGRPQASYVRLHPENGLFHR